MGKKKKRILKFLKISKFFHAQKQRKKENVLSELHTMPVTNKTFRLVSVNKSIGYIYDKNKVIWKISLM